MLQQNIRVLNNISNRLIGIVTINHSLSTQIVSKGISINSAETLRSMNTFLCMKLEIDVKNQLLTGRSKENRASLYSFYGHNRT